MVFLFNKIYMIGLVLSIVFARICCAEESGQWADSKAGITWQRCSLGQTWSGYNCDGEPKIYTWFEAQEAANAVGKGWRVPSASELMSLVRCSTGFQRRIFVPDHKGDNQIMPSRCKEGASRPTIDRAIFPNTPKNSYWSSSSFAGNNATAWLISFYYGDGDAYYSKLNYGYVRLVRSSQ